MNEEPYNFAWTQIGGWGIVIILVSLFSTAEAAEFDWAVGGFLFSDHQDSKRITNEDHRKSLYVRVNGWTVGRYEISYSTEENARYAWFGGYQTELGTWKRTGIDFSLMTGVTDNAYKGFSTERDFMPIVTLNAKFSLLKHWQAGRVRIIGWEFGKTDWEKWRKRFG